MVVVSLLVSGEDCCFSFGIDGQSYYYQRGKIPARTEGPSRHNRDQFVYALAE